METPERAIQHLLRHPLNELTHMPTAQLWPLPRPISFVDHDAEERSIELHSQANLALRVDEHGSALMAPKLDFRARASASLSGRERVIETRAIAAEIGWIETSLPGAASGAIYAVEDLLSVGHAEASEAIHHQLLVRSVRARPAHHVGDAGRDRLRASDSARLVTKGGSSSHGISESLLW